MDRLRWSMYTADAHRRASGRRRYNAMRRRRADERRAAILAVVAANPVAALLGRGLTVSLAAAYGVHRTTIWRDLQAVLYGGRVVNYVCDGELLYSVRWAYRGGPALAVLDADGRKITGPLRRRIVKCLPRYA